MLVHKSCDSSRPSNKDAWFRTLVVFYILTEQIWHLDALNPEMGSYIRLIPHLRSRWPIISVHPDSYGGPPSLMHFARNGWHPSENICAAWKTLLATICMCAQWECSTVEWTLFKAVSSPYMSSPFLNHIKIPSSPGSPQPCSLALIYIAQTTVYYKAHGCASLIWVHGYKTWPLSICAM